MRSRVPVGVLAVVALLTVAALGIVLGGARTEDRAYELEQRLRCPVCKSVSIADSPSESAQAMRRVVREQIAAGRSDEQIVDHFRARYGDWVLLDPPMSGRTLLLWITAFLGAVVGVAVLVLRRDKSPPRPELSAADRERVSAELERVRHLDEAEEQP